MKKTYLLMILGIICISSYAQRASNYHVFPQALQPSFPDDTEKQPINEVNRAEFDTIFYEDFVNGFTGAGTNGAWTVTGSFCTWVYTTQKPQGQYSTNANPLNSTSKTNGFMRLDGDSCNASGATPVDAALVSPVIDLSTYSGVILSFQHHFRYCCSSASKIDVEITTDGGTTWTPFSAKEGVAVNTYAANPLTTRINISSVAAGQANVQFRFKKTSASHYFWMVDDILLTESPTNDLVLERPYIELKDRFGYYNEIPVANVTPLSFAGAVFNNGTAPQTDSKMNVEIINSSGSAYTNITSGKSLLSLQRDTMEIIAPNEFTPVETGLHTVNYNIIQAETDALPTNNTRALTFTVSDSTFARDNGLGTLAVGPSNYVGGNVEDAQMGVIYEITTLAELNYISVYIHANTGVGTSIIGRVYDYDNATDEVGAELLLTDIYDIDDVSKKDKWVTLPFINKNGTNDIIASGKTVLVAFQVYGIVAGSTAATSKYVFAKSDVTTYHNGWLVSRINYDGTWGWIAATPFIRLIVAPGYVGVNETAKNENGLKLFQNQPNPAKGFTTIGYKLNETANVNLKVYNVTGKEVLSVNNGQKPAGTHNINLNTSSLASGIYYYTLTAGDKKATQKMVIIE